MKGNVVVATYKAPSRFSTPSYVMSKEETVVNSMLLRHDERASVQEILQINLKQAIETSAAALREFIAQGRWFKDAMLLYGFRQDVEMLDNVCVLRPDIWDCAKQAVMDEAVNYFLLHTLEYIRWREGNDWMFQHYKIHTTFRGGTPFLYSFSTGWIRDDDDDDEVPISFIPHEQNDLDAALVYFSVPDDLQTGNLTWDYYIKYNPDWNVALNPMNVWRTQCSSVLSDTFFELSQIPEDVFLQQLTGRERLIIFDKFLSTHRPVSMHIVNIMECLLMEYFSDILQEYKYNHQQQGRVPQTQAYVSAACIFINKTMPSIDTLHSMYQLCRTIPNFEKVAVVFADSLFIMMNPSEDADNMSQVPDSQEKEDQDS